MLIVSALNQDSITKCNMLDLKRWNPKFTDEVSCVVSTVTINKKKINPKLMMILVVSSQPLST